MIEQISPYLPKETLLGVEIQVVLNKAALYDLGLGRSIDKYLHYMVNADTFFASEKARAAYLKGTSLLVNNGDSVENLIPYADKIIESLKKKE